MRFSVWIAVLAIVSILASCRTSPMLLTPHVACGLAPNIWREVETPTEREALLALPEEATKRPISEYFTAAADQKEVWFEDANHHLQACLYDPTSTCLDGGRRNVVFSKLQSSWVSGKYTQTYCFH
jgi:hypothetical protein